MEAERSYDAATDAHGSQRTLSTLIAAVQNGPRYHPSLAPTPLTDETIDYAFYARLRPNARKAGIIARIEAQDKA
jgi:hypothetical protein